MTRPRPIFVSANRGGGTRGMSVMADAASTGGQLGVSEGIVPFGHSPSLHVHRDEDEAFYMLEGTLEFVCDGERFRAEAGAFVFLPRGLPHTFIGLTRPSARVLVLLTPGGLERIFVETNPEQLDAILQASGVETVGPPLSL
jgi:mannose-6-phosphate isomerase-like protein (cupin superfamily)